MKTSKLWDETKRRVIVEVSLETFARMLCCDAPRLVALRAVPMCAEFLEATIEDGKLLLKFYESSAKTVGEAKTIPRIKATIRNYGSGTLT